MKSSVFPRHAACILALFALGLSVARAADKPAAEPKKESTTALPAAREVLDRYVKTVGGREAMLKRSSFRLTGTMSMPAQGVSGTVEVFGAKPNKNLVKMQLEGIGEMQQAFDGKVGWSIDPVQGPMLIKEKMLEQLRDDADFYISVYDGKDFQSMETVEVGPFEGKECYKLKLVRKSGKESFTYFDVKSGLQIGSSTKQETQLGVMPVVSVVSDYKDFDGFKLATKTTQKIGAFMQVITINVAEFDKVQDSVFDQPAQIKALVK